MSNFKQHNYVTMLRNSNILFSVPIIVCLFLFSHCSTNDNETIIVPQNGFSWPNNNRDYWPTIEWQTAPMNAHNINPSKMEIANKFAESDPLSRALLVIKDGYLVYENYYGNGGINASTNLWSVTKSFSSALIGLILDDHIITSTNQLMADLLPQYPEFNNITLHHVLTQTTGLSWSEDGQPWNDWIFSDDWVASALARGQVTEPGEKFYYSSGNSHFLTSLVYYRTNTTPGILAKERLFDPIGIEFKPLNEPIIYHSWPEYRLPMDQSWRQDPKGIECASFGLYLTARDMAKFGYLYLNKGRWENQQLISESWVETSTKDHVTNIYHRYSYGYQWWITKVSGYPAFLASGFGGQIIGVVPSLDLVVVIKYEAENPEHPQTGSSHDDMHLFDLVVESINTKDN
jgi:CubicO group peptidase (beta-lactamase class C family)